jgi:hypothetical protein
MRAVNDSIERDRACGGRPAPSPPRGFVRILCLFRVAEATAPRPKLHIVYPFVTEDNRRMRRSITRVKPIRQILTAAPPDVMTQVIRLIVLYEDLKVEIQLLRQARNKDVDEVGSLYRRVYILRRAFATLLEIHSASHQLNMQKAFHEKRKEFSRERLKDWNRAIQFFSKNRQTIETRRNTYGAHVQETMARYILSLVEQTDETVGALEVRIDSDGSHRYVCRFAETLVNAGLYFDSGEQDREMFMRDSVQLLTDSIRHAASITHVLADYYILPTFGW